MKKILVCLLAIAIMATTCVVFAEEPDAEAVPLYFPCMVTGNKVRERAEANTDCKVICLHNKGDIVNVVDLDPEAEWWELDNGHFMFAEYLELMCSNDSPYATDVEETEDFLVQDEDVPEVVSDDASAPRVFNFAWMHPAGMSKQNAVAQMHNCVLLVTREKYIECYQNDLMVMRIDLTQAFPVAKFCATPSDGEPFEIKYIYEIADLIMRYSTDDSYFVVID